MLIFAAYPIVSRIASHLSPFDLLNLHSAVPHIFDRPTLISMLQLHADFADIPRYRNMFIARSQPGDIDTDELVPEVLHHLSYLDQYQRVCGSHCLYMLHSSQFDDDDDDDDDGEDDDEEGNGRLNLSMLDINSTQLHRSTYQPTLIMDLLDRLLSHLSQQLYANVPLRRLVFQTPLELGEHLIGLRHDDCTLNRIGRVWNRVMACVCLELGLLTLYVTSEEHHLVRSAFLASVTATAHHFDMLFDADSCRDQQFFDLAFQPDDERDDYFAGRYLSEKFSLRIYVQWLYHDRHDNCVQLHPLLHRPMTFMNRTFGVSSIMWREFGNNNDGWQRLAVLRYCHNTFPDPYVFLIFFRRFVEKSSAVDVVPCFEDLYQFCCVSPVPIWMNQPKSAEKQSLLLEMLLSGLACRLRPTTAVKTSTSVLQYADLFTRKRRSCFYSDA